MHAELLGRSLWEHRAALDCGEYSAVELTEAYLSQISLCEPTVGAYLTVDADGAMRAARDSDTRRSKGISHGLLDGIPYAAKDNFCTMGLRTTCASRMLENFIPPYDATVITRLRQAGAILLGKLNMDEFAMGSSNENSAFGITHNPRDFTCVAGGSSGGSAAAVAAFESVFAIGSDTGGSIRQPAAFCGVLGLKPTYGVLSRYGMVALSSSFDCVGLVTRDAADCAAILSALVGEDPRDATSHRHTDGDFSPLNELPPLRVAVVRELLRDGEISPDVIRACECAIEALRARGAEIEEISLPSPDQALASYCVLSAAEAASNMARYDGIRYGKRAETVADLVSFYEQNRSVLGDEVKRRILFGTYMLSTEKRELYYDRARQARRLIRMRLGETLDKYDLILNPTTPTGVFQIGEEYSPAQQRRADLCTVYANLAGFPALSVPFGKDTRGLPLSVHLTAAPFGERLLLSVAKYLEEVRP